jgi:hypothetical protein
MKVLNLRCANGHGFEGWFASDDAFMDQNERRLVECPLCADSQVIRLPSAPRLNLSGPRQVEVRETAEVADQVVSGMSMQAQWLKAVRHLIENTEDVGERFATEARRIHYGEIEARGIRGQASADDRQALREEGIEVMSMPLPAALKGPIQ